MQNRIFYLWSLDFPEEDTTLYANSSFSEDSPLPIVLIAQFGCDNTNSCSPFCFSAFNSLNYCKYNADTLISVLFFFVAFLSVAILKTELFRCLLIV